MEWMFAGAAIFLGGFWLGRYIERQAKPQPVESPEEKPQSGYNKSYNHPAIVKFYKENQMKDNPFFF